MGHGLNYLFNILEDIRLSYDFDILKIQKFKPKNIKSFVKEIYSNDYAPYWHLKEKTKYLNKTKKEVCFVFLRNNLPCEDFFGEKDFRHKESNTLKKLKEKLRDKYNPYENNIRSHNHIIHATDSEFQADKLLKYLGYKEGVNLFIKEHKFINIPYYLKGFKKFKVKNISCEKLNCSVIEGESWTKFKVKNLKIQDSPQFLGLTNLKIYEEYIKKFIGGPLQDDYNIQKFKKMTKEFKYLQAPYENSLILVEKKGEYYQVLDGLHRACIHFSNGNKNIKVCELIR